MDDYFLREFVKDRNKCRLSKVKLKKVVADILLAQKVRRFMVSVQADTQRKPRSLEAPSTKRRMSVRIVSPHSSRVSRGRSLAPDFSRPKSKSGAKTPVPSITVSSASRTVARENSGSVYPQLGNQRKKATFLQDTSGSNGSARMPRIENRSAHSTRSRSPKNIPPVKVGKNPVLLVSKSDSFQKTATHKSQTSLPPLPDNLWVGDPKAIGSVRRPRRNAQEMLASYKSGEDSRRLLRQMSYPCTRNCQKPNIVSELERIYDELPSIFPAIEKARKDYALEHEDDSLGRPGLTLFASGPSSRRNSTAMSWTSGRGRHVSVQTPTVRHHGPLLRQVTTGNGFRY